jgi:hypothetical protein
VVDGRRQSNGSATRNQPISLARLSSFRPKIGRMAEIRPFPGHAAPTSEGHDIPARVL